MVAIAEQLAYPSATVETFGGVTGAWSVVDSSGTLTQPDEVLRDGSDNTWIEADGSWQASTQPSILMRVQTLAGKLPLRRPYIDAQLFRLRFRYRIVSGGGSFSIGPEFTVVDYATDHPNVVSVPFPGRRNNMMAQTFTTELVEDAGWQELEMTLPSSWLKGHDDGVRSIGGIRDPQSAPIGYDSDLGVEIGVPRAFTGAPKLQISQVWYRVDEVEIGEACPPDYVVRRKANGTDFEVVDVAGNWAANGGTGGTVNGQGEYVFTTQVATGTSYSSGGDRRANCSTALVDAGRRAGLTKQYSGTAIVEMHRSVYEGQWAALAEQPNGHGFAIGKDGDNEGDIYWLGGTPGAPSGLVPVDGLVIRSEVVPDGYRDGNERFCSATINPNTYVYDGTFVEHGRVSYYGIRAWATTTTKAPFFNGSTGGKPGQASIIDLHDVQLTGTIFNNNGGIKNNNGEYTWGGRIAAMRHDLRHVRAGRGDEHSWYCTSPSGDSQIIDFENTTAISFYPNHAQASTVPFNANSTNQFVSRTNACTNNGNAPGSTPPGYGTLLWEGCKYRWGTGTHYKCAHTLGSLIVRRCFSFGTSGTQRSVQFSVESFGFVNQAPTPTTFGVDYSIGTFDSRYTTCTKFGGSNNPNGNTSQAYPYFTPANNPDTYCFKQLILEDVWSIGPRGNTVMQAAGADSVIVDRCWNSTGKWPFLGFWEWDWYDIQQGGPKGATWSRGIAGAFDNHRVTFRNVGPNPHTWYGAPTSSNGGTTVSRLMVYGARSNPNRPGGATNNPAYATIGQIQQLASTNNQVESTAWPLWDQTQQIDPGAAGAGLGYGWIYPCVRAPDLSDPDIYGTYFIGSNRRYPNYNTVIPAIQRVRKQVLGSVSLGTGGGVSATGQVGTRPRDTLSASIVLAQNVTGMSFLRPRVTVSGSTSQVSNVTGTVGERLRNAVYGFVSLDDQVDFSDFPARISLRVEEPDIVTDIPNTPRVVTDSVSGGGSFEGGVS